MGFDKYEDSQANSVIQQIFCEHLPCTGCYSCDWGYMCEQESKLFFNELIFQGKSWLAKSSGGEIPNDSVPQNELSFFRK